jgi:hypothetical protein
VQQANTINGGLLLQQLGATDFENLLFEIFDRSLDGACLGLQLFKLFC